MQDKRREDLLLNYISGNMDEATEAEFKREWGANPSLKSQEETLSEIWDDLGTLPSKEPSKKLRKRFSVMLVAYKQGASESHRSPWLNGLKGTSWSRRLLNPIGIAVVFLIIGFTAGLHIAERSWDDSELVTLRQDVDHLTQMLTLSLLRETSPSARLQGIKWVEKIETPNQRLINTLLEILNYDTNINVRLAVMDALYSLCDDEELRQKVIQSVDQQNSLMVQIALINLFVKMDAKEAIEILERLQKNHGLKYQTQWAIKELL